MSKISYIHGLGASSVPADEWAQRGKEVPGRQFIPYMNMTSGQMKLALLEEQLRILAGYYPEHRSELLPAITKLENTLHAGVHGIGLLESGYSDVMRLVNKAIRQAKYNTRPGGGTFAPRVSGVGFLEEDQLETYGGNYNTTTQPGASAAPNAANELPKEDLSKYAQLPNCQKIVDELRKIAPWNIGKKTAKKLELDECYNREKLVKVLNEKLENAGHHMIYDYATATVAAPYPAIVTKRILHSNAVAGFSSLSGVELKNMEMWLRNGIMRNNALKGASPLQPESTINVFRDYYKTQKGIGDPITATIALITAITAAITAAAGAAIAIIQQLRAAEVAKLGRDITNPNFSMEGEDFLTGGSGSGGSSNSWLLPVGAGVATLLLLSNNK